MTDLFNGNDLNNLTGTVKDAYNNVIPDAKVIVTLPVHVLLSGASSNEVISKKGGLINFSISSSSVGEFEIGANASSVKPTVSVFYSPVTIILNNKIING